jgi:hypothetical protein
VWVVFIERNLGLLTASPCRHAYLSVKVTH